jgi:hypothetical protein
MHAITTTVLGKLINTNPGLEVFEWMREELSKTPYIKMFREDPPYNTLLFEGSKDIFNHEEIKRTLYTNTGIKHWTGEW